jgi:hypothetical protein
MSALELAELRAWLLRSRRSRTGALLLASGLFLAPLVYVLVRAPELIPEPEPRVLGMALLAYLGASIVVCGVAGALWELCAPQRRWYRTFFVFACALALLPAWLFSARLDRAHEFLLVGTLVPLFGCAAFVARVIKQLQLGARLNRLERDLAAGQVELFRGAVERLSSEREHAPEGLVGEQGRVTLEVLPNAMLPWSSPMASPSAIVLLKVGETPVREELPEVPLATDEASVEWRQRSLTREEREELSRYARSLTRRAVIHGVVTFWFIALVLPALAKLAMPNVHSRVSFAAGCIALVTGFMRGASILQHRAKVQRDAAEGLVMIVRPSGSDEVESEFLPSSDLEWTVARAVAPWRRRHRAKSA